MYLGLDLGTSEIKAVVIDDRGQILASEGEPLTVQRPHPLWSEQNPTDWWQATQRVMARLRHKIPQRWGKFSPLVYLAKCTAQSCSTEKTASYARPFYGMMPAAPRSVRN